MTTRSKGSDEILGQITLTTNIPREQFIRIVSVNEKNDLHDAGLILQ